MKQLLQALIFLLMGELLFSSCSSGISISKRRYTKGYYVHQQGKSTKPVARDNTKQNKKVRPMVNVAKPASQQIIAPGLQDEPILTASAADEKLKTVTPTGFTGQSAGTIAAQMVAHPIKTIKSLSDKISADPAKSEALSLLWILIVVLAAVYVVGLLLDSFGLGWVIHLLLVVILVLLILWLLRII